LTALTDQNLITLFEKWSKNDHFELKSGQKLGHISR
jgi:hypothetical protein